LKNNIDTKPIIPLGYYSNKLTYDGFSIYTKFHPKTLVYMVQYYSHSTKSYRYIAIVGMDIKKDDVTGYNYKYSGFWDFLIQHSMEFMKKRAYIYPIFWFMVERLYRMDDVKIILI
jgi:hypothetical protein